MKLWFIRQTETRGYDAYDSAVVAAETLEDARSMHPDGCTELDEWASIYATWATSPQNVEAELIGDAVPGTKASVIVASFNAG